MTAHSLRKGVQRPIYQGFQRINGEHDYRSAVPGAYVEYPVRRRHGGKVAFFNFDLAKEMGLIPAGHPHALTKELEKALLETFSLVIINEYDVAKHVVYPKEDILPNKYMATRYLQLQHPDKRGTTSGDGRSIWNGQFKHRGVTWDVSSCGTGATSLSPAVAIGGKWVKTGDEKVAYGCGRAELDEGLSAAIMSEIFHKNGIGTERTLAIIEFAKGQAINVRAAKNLLRPSHFFMHLKQENHEKLKAAIDYFIDRQIANGDWPFGARESREKKYERLAEYMALTFSKIAAQFESEYIFCWLDWDGDNILATGGIIDYGSVRQMGLYHHEYRYDDDSRFSTNIPEQKKKARYTVQTFCQIRDYLLTGKKKSIKAFANDPILKVFDQNFDRNKSNMLLHRVGFNAKQVEALAANYKSDVLSFRKIFSHFEFEQASRQKYVIADGVTRDAMFCMRDILRELPGYYLSGNRYVDAQVFLDAILSTFAKRGDRLLTPQRAKRINEFQSAYNDLIDRVSSHFGTDPQKILLELTMRSSSINRYDRITGDAVILATDQIIKYKKKLSADKVQKIIEDFIHYQVFHPKHAQDHRSSPLIRVYRKMKSIKDRLFLKIVDYVTENREGI